MSEFEVMADFNTANCYVCNEYVEGDLKSEMMTRTGYSERPIYQILESFTGTQFSEELLNEAGVCQNCYIKLNEFDEHSTIAEQLQFELVSIMEKASATVIEEVDVDDNIKCEEIENVGVIEEIEYDGTEPPEYEELFTETNEAEEVEDALVGGDYHYEIVVDDTKENIKREVKPTPYKSAPRPRVMDPEFVVLEYDNQKLYQCDICFKTFKDKSKLRTHREIHTDERNVICPECGKAFKTMNCLRNHKRLHVPERTYFACSDCDKKYTQKVQLKKHIEIVHHHKRDFACNQCGATFGTNSVLKMHLLSHQEFRAEKCDICEYRFHTKAKLRRHMKSHTGERNYECPICQKKFLYSYNVVAHVRNVHEKVGGSSGSVELLECNVCNEKFQKAPQLREHLLQVHGAIGEEAEEFEYEEIRADDE